MDYSNRLRFDTIRTLAFGGISGVFAAVGGALTVKPRLIKIQNVTNQPVELTSDGTNVQDYIPANSFTLYDLTANKVTINGAFISEGVIFSVRRPVGVANPTSGAIYITIIYGE